MYTDLITTNSCVVSTERERDRNLPDNEESHLLPCSSLKVMFVSCLAYFSTQKMEVTCSTETSIDFQRTTGRYITEDRTLHNHRCDNFISSRMMIDVNRHYSSDWIFEENNDL
jgi:hypothetical protein